MAVCARAVAGPDGALLLALDPTRTDLSTCAYVVEDGASNAWRELGSMSLQNASDISLAVGLVWAVAWGIKTIGRTLRTVEEKES